MTSIANSVTIEEEIGAFMIATSAILLLSRNPDTEISPETCTSSISSASKSQAVLWQENVCETEMTCDEIADTVNQLRRQDELNTLVVDSLALEHGISRLLAEDIKKIELFLRIDLFLNF